MFHFFASSTKAENEKQQRLLMRERTEIRQISDVVIRKLENKLEMLKAMESSIDKKIAAFESLIQQAEAIKSSGEVRNRPHEIMALYKKGLKAEDIAAVLAMPVGEVQLIVELHTAVAQA
ncbi:MAG: hypothetical protein HGA43_12635 [Nitrospirae bacterium]|nr:hypothetical protein [Nitrospirota bacterium]